MKIPSIGCVVNRHKPIRNRVRVGREYTGECKHCGASIHRVERGLWKRHREVSAQGDAA